MTEDTWRPWEQRRFLVDRQIIQTETGRSISEDYSVDFLEPNYALTPETEVLLWDWRIKNGLSTKEEWFMYNNPDYSPEDLEEFSQRQIDNQKNASQSRLLNILQNGSD